MAKSKSKAAERGKSEPELPILGDGGAEDLGGGEHRPRVLITGACGNIGRKLRRGFGDDYDLVLIDKYPERDNPEDAGVFEADLSVVDDGWPALFDEVDAVIHLAATPNEFSSWEELVGPNLDALLHVCHVAAAAGVDRIVFASSNHVMGGYRNEGTFPITTDLPPRPGNPYGAAKLMGERLGKSVAEVLGVSFVALRLGWVQAGENRPETLTETWWRRLWLSNGDLTRLFRRALEVPLESEFVVVNGISRNAGSRWDLTEARARLGYEPEDDAFADGA